MQFLYPGVLWGLLALAIPLIVHLFNFRRTKRVYFSNVSLLKTVDTKTSSLRRLKHFLIMLARMLFITALVLAFAQPVKRSIENQGMPLGINGIYLDNSPSMQNTIQDRSLLDQAIIKIDELLSLLERSSNIQMLTNDFESADQFLGTAGQAKDRLTTIAYSESGRNLSQVYNRQQSIADKNNPSGGNHFFWFSDFQKSTVGPLEEIQPDSNTILHLIPVVGKEVQNLFVDSLWLSVPFVREMQNNLLNVRLYNSGNKKVEKLPIKLFIDNIQTSTSSLDLDPNTYGTVSFNFTLSDRGIHKGRVSFDDQPITFDNDYFFTVDVSPSIRILHLYGERSPQNYISKIFSDDSLFVYKSYPLDNFDPGEIQKTDLLVMEGLTVLDGERKITVDRFIDQGGNVFVIPSSSPSLGSFQQFLGPYGINRLTIDSHLPAANRMIEVAEPDKNTPFFADVFEKGVHSSVISLPNVFAKLDWSGVGEKILTLRNGKPYLTRTRVKEGNLYMLASPLDKSFGNFAEHALFVPTLFKMAYLSMKPERLSYNFDEGFIKLYLPDSPKNAVYKLENNNLEIIPGQSLADQTLTLTLPKSSELQGNEQLSAGIFDLKVNDQVKKSLAVNHSKEESILEFYSVDELKEQLGSLKNIRIYEDLSDGDFIQAFRDTSIDKFYWKYFIIAALVFLLAEVLIYRFLK